MRVFIGLIVVLLCFSFSPPEKKPNVILIMADDMGYECISAYGSRSYHTPNIDKLAAGGIRFQNCISQPLCTPSRVKIMTGKYNYRNYEYFGYLNTSEYTFGNLMQDAAYKTCIAGKWQLNGIDYKDKVADWNDTSRPNKMGFNEYCLWQLNEKGHRYAQAKITINGKPYQGNVDEYGPDLFSNYILDFIDRNKQEPFFVYYPMVLVHDPFLPTPDSEDWSNPENRFKNDTTYFKDMVSYTDKIVGKIMDKLEALGIADNTIVIFTGDNGTSTSIYSQMPDGVVHGAKGNTIDAGVHVPLVVKWPSKIKSGYISEDLVEFSDFFPTFADVIGAEKESDGRSFYPLLVGERYQPRKNVFVHYDPRWGAEVSSHRNQFVQSKEYKLYSNGNFFNIPTDKLEIKPLKTIELGAEEYAIRSSLETALRAHPKWE